MVAVYRSLTARAPTTEIARDTSQQATPKNDPERIEPGSQQSAVTPAPGAQPAAVAQKVVLYEEDPADPNGKRFVGSAIWRTETVSPGPGQPPDLAVRADVEIPERKLAMTWSLRRNTDKALPASHTVEIMFKLPADFPSGGISNVPGILMKQAEQTRGMPLAGLAVKVTNGFFLIGLSAVGRRQGAQRPAAQGARLVRHPGRLQQQPPRHPRDGKGHARRARVRRRLQGLEAVISLVSRRVQRGCLAERNETANLDLARDRRSICAQVSSAAKRNGLSITSRSPGYPPLARARARTRPGHEDCIVAGVNSINAPAAVAR